MEKKLEDFGENGSIEAKTSLVAPMIYKNNLVSHVTLSKSVFVFDSQ